MPAAEREDEVFALNYGATTITQSAAPNVSPLIHYHARRRLIRHIHTCPLK